MGVTNTMKGIIIAGGRGTRFSNPTNKSLLLFKGKPLIFYNIEMLLPLCSDVFVVTGYDSEHTKKEISQVFPQVIFLHNTDGVVSSLKYALTIVSDIIDDNDFITCFGDEIALNNDIEHMLDFFYGYDSFGVIGAYTNGTEERIKKCFSIEFEDNIRVKNLVEKPTKIINNWHGTGYGMFKKSVLDYISTQTNYPEVIQTAINNNEIIHAYNLKGEFFNVNYQEDYSNLLSRET